MSEPLDEFLYDSLHVAENFTAYAKPWDRVRESLREYIRQLEEGRRAPPAQPAGGVSEWIACSERMPEPSTMCLVHEDGAMRCMLYNARCEWECLAVALDQYGDALRGVRVRESGVYEPTHWMPLPAPPALAAFARSGGVLQQVQGVTNERPTRRPRTRSGNS